MKRILSSILVLVAVAALCVACESKSGGGMKAAQATAQFLNTDGKAIGSAVLTQTDKGVKIELELSGLTPGSHAFHIHETGKADPPDFKSAGGHFNPMGKQHGHDNPMGSHAGDLPNIEVPASGSVKLTVYAHDVTLEKGPANSLFKPGGTSFVIHAGPDDNVSDPSGNAGSRVACAVIAEK